MRPSADHSLIFHGPINNLHEAPSIGNGDLGVLVQVFQNEFRLHLGKSDVFDARTDYDTARSVYPQEKLIRASRDYGFRLEGPNYHAKPAWDRPPPPELEWPDDGQGMNTQIFPCPKPAGFIAVRHSGISSTAIETTVDIARGVVTSSFTFDYGWHGTGRLVVEAFADAEANAVRLRLTADGLVGALHLAVGKMPDPLDPTLPPPETSLLGGRHGRVTQRIPAGHGAAPFAWHLAAVFPEKGDGVGAGAMEALPYQLLQKLSLAPGRSAEWSVGVATDRERADGLALATELADTGALSPFTSRLESHTTRWSLFWDASGIELEDKELEKTWYRNLFALNTHIRKGALAPGLCANVVPYEKSPWHGVYTVNMNIQKMFLPALPSGHPEWIECYADWLDHMLPGMEHLCRLTFGFEGIYIPHMVLPFVAPDRQFSTNTAGRALGMTGWMGQPLWWHWEYTRDRGFLETRVYPYLKRAADFYVRYFERFMDASGDIFPSLNLESPPWTRNFEHNRDCLIDLILIRNTFVQAMAAATALGVDPDKRAEWASALKRVRPVSYEWLPDGHAWIRGDRNDRPPEDPAWWDSRENRGSAAVRAAWTIFPGEYADGDEADGVAAACRDILRRTGWQDLHPAVVWIHHWWCSLPALRLGLDNAFEKAREIILKERFPAGHARTTHYIHLQPDAWRVPEDNYLGVSATTEMLLQSQGGLIRLFPCWPKDRHARFRGFPARGGFLVDAQWSPACGLSAGIRSLAGEPCRLRWTADRPPAVTCGGRPVPCVLDRSILSFQTQPGQDYQLAASDCQTPSPP
jgi:hypothetical protein